jgi:L-ascorbate metabolism protein UlaG (beta-lactamase superfamily)
MVDDAQVRATFLGTSTIYLDDGTSAILVDGFVSRPSLLRVAFGRIEPDPERITRALARAGISRLDALLVAHSHHDHAMDAPEIVRRLGGVMYGSASTLNIGRGRGLDEGSMAVVGDGDALTVGAFTIRIFEGAHSPGNRFPGTIDEPLVPPARASTYRDGGCYSFHISHSTGTLLIHPSANFIPHQFDGLDVDALYLGVGAVGAQSKQFQDDYWRHVVEATRPTVILPVHWDNFFRSLDRPLQPLPFFMDKFDRTKGWLDRKSTESGIPVRFPRPFETVTPLG